MAPRPEPAPSARIGVGMSGGLDSSVVAALLHEQGYEVIGLTLHMFREGSRCCSADDIDRARRVCDFLGIAHSTINVVDYFQEAIVQPFVEEYMRGRTPSPCVHCNQYVKFGALHTRAMQMGCAFVATGHYVKVELRADGYHLLCASDRHKDQSYFLHRLSQVQLSRCLFPLESWHKPEVAAYAERRALPVSSEAKAESQDLCFVSDEGHGPFLETVHPELKQRGEIVDSGGTTLGTHPGYHHFTVGQRRGLGVAASGRLYVQYIDPVANRIVVGGREALLTRECTVDDVHWIAEHPPPVGLRCQVRIRYRTPAAPAELTVSSPRRVHVHFDKPQFAIAPGQAAVIYLEEEVLGGGWIGGPYRSSH
jgi:tRNA-specific 2-thiouridylase